MNDQTRFERHGRVRVAPGGRHLAHDDGTPFFYLADTAWNGALLATEADWNFYLADRAAKGFTAIQFILAAPWAAAITDECHQQAYTVDDAMGPNDYEINQSFFDRMDHRFRAINDAGLLAVPVLAWAARFGESQRLNPGVALPADFLSKFIHFEIDRYRDRHVMWILAGDGKYDGWWRSRKWKRLGSALPLHHAPIAMHPMGKTWPYESFRNQSWLDVLGYQSGHSTDPKIKRWLLEGPPARAWRTEIKPIINLEPCYEGIRNWATSGVCTATDVRHAMYASLLNAPTAGITYGAHGVWSWETKPREPLNHNGSGIAKPWHEAINLPGSVDVHRMADLFNSLDWPRLRPAEDLKTGPTSWDVSCSATDTRDLVVCYLPNGGAVSLSVSGDAEWFDPRTGSRITTPTGRPLSAPDNLDWILILRRKS